MTFSKYFSSSRGKHGFISELAQTIYPSFLIALEREA